MLKGRNLKRMIKRAMIRETAQRSGLTHLIDFLEIEKNVDGYDYKMELSKKIEDGLKIEENIDTTAWISRLGIKIDEANCPVTIVKQLQVDYMRYI